jgi:sporulation protein YlmC with PRC-barrel domain
MQSKQEPTMLKPMSKPLLTLALLTAVGVATAQAQTATPHSTATPDNNPSIAMTTAPTGADARKLLGRSIKNMQNDTIGDIKSIHLDPGGKVDAVVASVGGFLGVGDREVLLDWRDLKIEDNGNVVRVDMTKDELKSKPAYSYKDQSTRGTVFTDSGVWNDNGNATRADRRNDTASANTPTNTTTTRSTGDFNVAGQMSAESLVGKTVKNAANESVGKINDFYLDASGAVKLVVVSVGGFLGVGSKDVGVPWTDLKFGRDGNNITVLTNWTKDSLKAMPDYKDERRMQTGGTRSGG